MEAKVIITPEELSSLKKAQDDFEQITITLGSIEIEIQNYLDLKSQTIKKFQELKKEQDNLGKILNDKYGPGTVDLSTGEFIKK